MSIRNILQQKGHRVAKVRPTDTVASAVRSLAEQRIGALVVEDSWMRPVGMFSERDFVNAVAKHGAATLELTVETLMSSPIISCQLSDSVDSAMAKMTLAKIRHLPIFDDGELVGIVSIGDLVKHRLDEKELETHVLLDLNRMRA